MLFSEQHLDPREYNPLALAYIGDTVFDLFVRTRVLEKGNRHVTDMHADSVRLVNAVAQAKMAALVEDMLDGEELRILKWGRNARVNTHPKGATIAEYHMATGFETLIGFLYLNGSERRLCEILGAAYAKFKEE